jgi:Ca-activated chloride channel family protein
VKLAVEAFLKVKADHVDFNMLFAKETCGGDPVKTAKELRKQHIKVNVIGFDFKEGFNGNR